jgi:hypothetical protein
MHVYVIYNFSAYGRWPLTRTEVISRTSCASCGAHLETRPVPAEALASLRSEFRRILNACVQSSISVGATRKEVALLERVLGEMRPRIRNGKRPLVVDALNLGGGNYTNEYRIAWFCKTLVELAGAHGYGPVLV